MFLLIINIIYLILGMLMETVPIILTVPIFYPMALTLGVDPVLSMVGQLRMFYLFGLIGILFVTYAPGAILWIIN